MPGFHVEEIDAAKRQVHGRDVILLELAYGPHTDRLLGEDRILDVLNPLKVAAFRECERAVQSGNLMEEDPGRVATKKIKEIPSTFFSGAIKGNQVVFEAHSFGISQPWIVNRNDTRQQYVQQQAAMQAQQRAADEKARLAVQAREGVDQWRQKYSTSLQSAEGREFVLPIVELYRQKVVGGVIRIECRLSYEYVGGAVRGRSVEGNVGVFLIEVAAVNKSETAVGRDSFVGDFCGNPNAALQPGQLLLFEAKARFRKYDTGWRFEELLK